MDVVSSPSVPRCQWALSLEGCPVCPVFWGLIPPWWGEVLVNPRGP